MAAAINGRQGHPALIPAAHIPAILARPASGESPGSPPGLRGYYQLLESQGQAVIQVPLPDAGVLSDLDTAGDSAAAGAWLAATRGRSLPSPAEAWQLLCLADLSAKKMRHSLLVARGSLRLGLRLAGRGLLPENSLLLLTGAGLLHDLTRQDREHAMSAARLLRGLGWPHSAFVVGCHTRLPEAYLARMGIHGPDKKFQCPDIPPEAAADPALDRELFHAAVAVYMADKYARRDHLSDISARFKDIRDWFRNDAAALEGIDEREKTVRAVESWLQELLGCELLQVVGAPSGHALEAELDALAGDAFQ